MRKPVQHQISFESLDFQKLVFTSKTNLKLKLILVKIFKHFTFFNKSAGFSLVLQ